jgi:hypothetical protein
MNRHGNIISVNKFRELLKNGTIQQDNKGNLICKETYHGGQPVKATDKEIINSYKELNNIWIVAEKLGMCGQSVHERLIKLGVKLNHPKFSENEKQLLKEQYIFYRDIGKLSELAKKINRTVPFICRKAKELGLTDKKHLNCHKGIENNKISEYFDKHGHPKGMLGKHHSQETKDKLSITSTEVFASFSAEKKSDISLKAMKTKEERYGRTVPNDRKVSWKQGWRNIGGIEKYYRSKWEANYARYLQFLKEHNEITEWLHEPEKFWFEKIKSGTRCYLPDFKVTLKNGIIEFHEVKGWMDAKSKTKISRFRKYYPQYNLLIIDAKWFKSNNKIIAGLIKDWEY